MKIRPLHDRLIIKRLEEERKTASGIVIPDSAAEKPEQGEVKAIGKGKVQEDGNVRPLDADAQRLSSAGSFTWRVRGMNPCTAVMFWHLSAFIGGQSLFLG